MPFDAVTRFMTSDYSLDLRQPIALWADGAARTSVTIAHLPPDVAKQRDIEAIVEVRSDHDEPLGSATFKSVDGRLEQVASESFLPPRTTLTDFGDRIEAEHRQLAERTLTWLRWRLCLPGGHAAVVGLQKGVVWEASDGAHGEIPRRFAMRISSLPLHRPTDGILLELRESAPGVTSEPLRHELLREATEQLARNPRSALVMGIAALEVGTKEFIEGRLPDAGWLVQEIPTPPVVRMIEEFLLILAKSGGLRVLPPPGRMLQRLRSGVKARNRVTHTKGEPLAYPKLDERLADFRDVLYLLDYVGGRAWAIDHVRGETRAAMGLVPTA